MTTPTRRVVLLGASNVALSFATIVQTVRAMWREPVEIMAAMGHGRSYGQDSWVLGRKISGIFSCALWQDLHRRPALPTTAFLTDVGNDLMYGVPPAQLVEWVAGCVDRLNDAGATTTIAQLPIGSLDRLGEARFRFFLKLLFPRSPLTLASAKEAANATNEGLLALGRAQKLSVIPVSDAWYGIDPIHVRRSVRRTAWPTMFSAWCESAERCDVTACCLWERAYLACLAPHEQSIFGVRRRTRQPCGRLIDGTTIALY